MFSPFQGYDAECDGALGREHRGGRSPPGGISCDTPLHPRLTRRDELHHRRALSSRPDPARPNRSSGRGLDPIGVDVRKRELAHLARRGRGERSAGGVSLCRRHPPGELRGRGRGAGGSSST